MLPDVRFGSSAPDPVGVRQLRMSALLR